MVSLEQTLSERAVADAQPALVPRLPVLRLLPGVPARPVVSGEGAGGLACAWGAGVGVGVVVGAGGAFLGSGAGFGAVVVFLVDGVFGVRTGWVGVARVRDRAGFWVFVRAFAVAWRCAEIC